jgi:hypothetical protein
MDYNRCAAGLIDQLSQFLQGSAVSAGIFEVGYFEPIGDQQY